MDNINWETATWQENKVHPHRRVLVELIHDFKPKSVLELGCGYGQNLFNIKTAMPSVSVTGIDIDETRIKEGIETYKIDLSVGDILKVDFPKDSFDVVMTDAVYLMINMTTDEVIDLTHKIIKIAKKGILLIEWHREGEILPGTNVGGRYNERYVRDYMELLKVCGAKNIKFRKITDEEWDSTNWRRFGYYITATT